VFAVAADVVDGAFCSALLAVERLTELIAMSAGNDTLPCHVDLTK